MREENPYFSAVVEIWIALGITRAVFSFVMACTLWKGIVSFGEREEEEGEGEEKREKRKKEEEERKKEEEERKKEEEEREKEEEGEGGEKEGGRGRERGRERRERRKRKREREGEERKGRKRGKNENREREGGRKALSCIHTPQHIMKHLIRHSTITSSPLPFLPSHLPLLSSPLLSLSFPLTFLFSLSSLPPLPYQCFPREDVGIETEPRLSDVKSAMNQDISLKSTGIVCEGRERGGGRGG